MTTAAAKVRYQTERGEPARYFRETVLTHEVDACLFWPYARFADGYGAVRLDGRVIKVHRRVCEAVHGPAPSSEHEAAHSCGKGKSGCVAKAHLSWKTHAGNMADRIDHGTSNRGQSHGMAKITDATAREILRLKGKMLQREIAAKFDVNKSSVKKIHARETWAWL